jgi:hypothetical protein
MDLMRPSHFNIFARVPSLENDGSGALLADLMAAH